MIAMENWITVTEVAELTGWHPQSVRRLAREGQLRHRPSKAVRRDGRAQREYALSSLPIEAQLKFLKQPLLSGPACTALALRSDLRQSNLFASLPVSLRMAVNVRTLFMYFLAYKISGSD
jgi:hypothetical protein